MSLYTRLEKRLEEQSDDAGAVRGTYSHRPDADDLAGRQPRRDDAAHRNAVRARCAVRPRARPDRRRHGRRRGGARAGRCHRHADRPADDGADPRAVRHPRQPPSGHRERDHPDGVELGAGDARRHLARLHRGVADRLLEPRDLRRAVPDHRRDPRDLRPRRRRARRAVVRRGHPGDRGVHLLRRRSRRSRPRTSRRSRPTPEPFYSPGLVFDVVLATAISWTVLAADFNRFARTTRAGAVGSGIGYTLSTVISMSLGATAIGYVVLSGGEAIPFDPVTIIEPFGALFAVAIFLSVMATNTMVVYGMVTTVVNAIPGRRVPFLADGARARGHLDHRLDVLRAARSVHDVPGDHQRAVRTGLRDHDRRLLPRSSADPTSPTSCTRRAGATGTPAA